MASNKSKIESMQKRIDSLEEQLESLKFKDSLSVIDRLHIVEETLFNCKKMLTFDETALFLGMSRSHLYKMTHMQIIPHYKPRGKMVYFDKEDLIKWMQNGRVNSLDPSVGGFSKMS